MDRLKLPPLVTLLAAMRGGGGLCLLEEWQRLYDSIVFESCLSLAQGDRRTVSNNTQILKFSLGDANFGLVYETKLEGAMRP